jgi:uncharacterized coiled-coil protein SlyX
VTHHPDPVIEPAGRFGRCPSCGARIDVATAETLYRIEVAQQTAIELRLTAVSLREELRVLSEELRHREAAAGAAAAKRHRPPDVRVLRGTNGRRPKRTTGVEPATYGLGSRRSAS